MGLYKVYYSISRDLNRLATANVGMCIDFANAAMSWASRFLLLILEHPATEIRMLATVIGAFSGSFAQQSAWCIQGAAGQCSNSPLDWRSNSWFPARFKGVQWFANCVSEKALAYEQIGEVYATTDKLS